MSDTKPDYYLYKLGSCPACKQCLQVVTKNALEKCEPVSGSQLLRVIDVSSFDTSRLPDWLNGVPLLFDNTENCVYRGKSAYDKLKGIAEMKRRRRLRAGITPPTTNAGATNAGGTSATANDTPHQMEIDGGSDTKLSSAITAPSGGGSESGACALDKSLWSSAEGEETGGAASATSSAGANAFTKASSGGKSLNLAQAFQQRRSGISMPSK